MIVKCLSKETLQDKKNPKQFYDYNKVYKVDADTGKRLIESEKFEEVKEEKIDKKEGK